MLVFNSLSLLLHNPGFPAQGMVSPTVAPPLTSSKVINFTPTKDNSSLRFPSQVIPDCVKLTQLITPGNKGLF